MIEVIATMCVLGTTLDVHPTELLKNKETRKDCKQISRTYHEPISKLNPYTCMLNSQKFAIDWLKTHPGWQVRSLGCRPWKGTDA